MYVSIKSCENWSVTSRPKKLQCDTKLNHTPNPRIHCSRPLMTATHETPVPHTPPPPAARCRSELALSVCTTRNSQREHGVDAIRHPELHQRYLIDWKKASIEKKAPVLTKAGHDLAPGQSSPPAAHKDRLTDLWCVESKHGTPPVALTTLHREGGGGAARTLMAG